MFLKESRSSSSCTSFMGLAALITTIALLLCSSSVLIGNAQQGQQLTNQPSTTQNGTATRTAVSPEDSFKLQIPPGWIISDLNNTGSALGVEVLQGYGILAQLCPADQQQQQQQQQLQPQEAAFSNAVTDVSNNTDVSSNQTTNLCQISQDQVIHIVRYPNLRAGLGFNSANSEDNNNNLTPDVIQSYEIGKLQEAGYRDIRIVNNSDTTIDLDLGDTLNNNNNNNTMSVRLPAKLAELTYSTNLNPNETKGGYFLSTATAATSSDLESITGYAIFYEGDSPSAIAQEVRQQPTMINSGSLVLEPITPLKQVIDSFELIARPEAVQAAIAAQTARATQETQEIQATEEQTQVDPLTVEIDSNATEGKAPVTIELEADISHGTKPYTISWDVDGDGVAESNQQSFTVTFYEADTYDTVVTVRDATGQIASDTIKITIDEGEESSSSSSSTRDEEPQIEQDSADETICDPSYVDTCIPPPPPNLTCDDVDASNFGVRSPDPHGFDDDNDGIGCESEEGSNNQLQQQRQQPQPQSDPEQNNAGTQGESNNQLQQQRQQPQPQSDPEQNNAGTNDSRRTGGIIGRVIDMFYDTDSR
jgi:hypothetical protein